MKGIFILCFALEFLTAWWQTEPDSTVQLDVLVISADRISNKKNVSGQHLHGVVLDAASKKPISDVAIFFPEFHRGTVSSSEGRFEIQIPKSGHFLLQVSHIGYENLFMNIEMPEDSILEIFLKPTYLQIQEVVITGNQSQSPDETSFNVVQLSANEMRQIGALSLSDGMSRLPGMSQLTTGSGISKPVIRGLYGNRIQVNVNGMRFDNQQWQDEHGLGLSDMGVDRVEIIKGPSAVLYGADAIGGVLNVIEEKPAAVNSSTQDFNIRLFSNTYGASAQYGIKKSTEKKWWRLRAGLDSHGDYSDGKNDRVLNSRFASYNMKASVGYNRRNRVTVNNLFMSWSKFGFVFDSLSRKEKDRRLSRSFDGPHHEVFFMQGTTENTFYREGKSIKLNGGVVSNLRQEDEGGGGISLSMLLNSASILAQVNQSFGKAGEWIYGVSFFAQTNSNYGGRIIIPNATTGDASAFSLYRLKAKKFLLEGGLRYDFKLIRTFATNTLNIRGNDSPTQEILPFKNFYNAFNISFGTSVQLTQELDFKSNASTGYRPGNLAELSSNGLHEGSLRWEIGKPDARIEQNLNVEGSLIYAHEHVRASVSVYKNDFRNYFYLAPTGLEYFGFQIYRFQQSNATLKGGEAMIDWNPTGSRLALTSSYSFISARKADGNYLPFIPANKINSDLKYFLRRNTKASNSSIRVGGTYVFAQNHPSDFETSTNAYFLLNAGGSLTGKRATWSLTCNNLLNKTYFDHLSRFKYYGIYNMGRNIVLCVNFLL
jgi:iron complex outermembrane receptor protein